MQKRKWDLLPITKTEKIVENKLKIVNVDDGMSVITKLLLILLTSLTLIGITAFLVKETAAATIKVTRSL